MKQEAGFIRFEMLMMIMVMSLGVTTLLSLVSSGMNHFNSTVNKYKKKEKVDMILKELTFCMQYFCNEQADASGNESLRLIEGKFSDYHPIIMDVSSGINMHFLNEYNYHRDGKRWHTVTKNKVSFDAGDQTSIVTITQVDGLGRTVQVAKTGVKYNASTGRKEQGWNISGAVEYDRKGRTVSAGQTVFSTESMEAVLAAPPAMVRPTTTEYDQLDRPIRTVLSDGSVQLTEYGVKGGMQELAQIDDLGNMSLRQSDVRGNILRTARYGQSNELLTEATYKYNALGEMLEAIDAAGGKISAGYDMLGRTTYLESVDGGRVEYEYDESSNLIRETNAVLRENGQYIAYQYDGLNRLILTDYPETADVTHVYGDSSAGNGAGRILSTTDGTGTIHYEYGQLGEVVGETRSLYSRSTGVVQEIEARMEYRSDYLGRMQYIKYPDGEEISYLYDAGGQITGVRGEHNGHTFEYIHDIGYDEYGQRLFVEYGNGVRTWYSYDEDRRWLDSIRSVDGYGQTLQDMTYRFDTVGNVLGYTNDAGSYSTSQDYRYDGLYQLVAVEGRSVSNPHYSGTPQYTATYRQEFTFDSLGLGNMVEKTSTQVVEPNRIVGDSLEYRLDYEYADGYSHRVSRIGERHYLYDSNGNVVAEQDGAFDEERRIYSSSQVLDYGGGVYGVEGGWGMAPSGNAGGGGGNGSLYRRDYRWNERNLLVASSDSNISVEYEYGADGQRSRKSSSQSETLYFNSMWTWRMDAGSRSGGGRNAKHIYVGRERVVTKLNSAGSPSISEEMESQYWWHSDHLGSAQLVTDHRGGMYQRLEYTPYGETWIEHTENTGLQHLPYKFTGKELDEETGLYYYGARYLDPKTSRWLSTDPALGEYLPKAPVNDEARRYNENLPGMGGIYNHINSGLYHYAGNNPVRYVDPDGRDINDVDSELVMSSANNESVLGIINPSKRAEFIVDVGCVLTAYTRIANSLGRKSFTLEDANEVAIKNNLFTNGNELTPENGATLINKLLTGTGKSVTYAGSMYPNSMTESGSFLNSLENSYSKLYVTARIDTYNETGTENYQHTVNINSGSVIAGDIMDISNALNIRINDTSGVRTQVTNDVRWNKILRMDYFRVN